MSAASQSRERPPEGAQRVQVLDRAVLVLQTIARQSEPLNAFDLARRCGLNRTTTWRILVTLEHNQLVERDPLTQRYRIGLGLSQLAAGNDHAPLIRRARPVVQPLADRTGEQISLGVPQHFGCTYVDHVQPPDAPPVPRWIGPSGPLHATSSGKVLLASLPTPERDALLGDTLERFTATTITDRAELDRQLAAIASDGYATTFGEHSELTSAACAGVYDTDGRLVAIVDAWGPSQRLTRARLRELGPQLRAAADELATRLA